MNDGGTRRVRLTGAEERGRFDRAPSDIVISAFVVVVRRPEGLFVSAHVFHSLQLLFPPPPSPWWHFGFAALYRVNIQLVQNLL